VDYTIEHNMCTGTNHNALLYYNHQFVVKIEHTIICTLVSLIRTSSSLNTAV